MNEVVLNSFGIEVSQPRFMGAETQSTTAQRAVAGYTARAAEWTSKSKLKFPVDGTRFGEAKLEVAIAATISKGVGASNQENPGFCGFSPTPAAGPAFPCALPMPLVLGSSVVGDIAPL